MSAPAMPRITRHRDALILLAVVALAAALERWLDQAGLWRPVVVLAPVLVVAGLITIPARALALWVVATGVARLGVLASTGQSPTEAGFNALTLTLQALVAGLFLRWRLREGLQLTRVRPIVDMALAAIIAAAPVGTLYNLLLQGLDILRQDPGLAARAQGIARHQALAVLNHTVPYALSLTVLLPLIMAALSREGPFRDTRQPGALPRAPLLRRLMLIAVLALAHGVVLGTASAQLLPLLPAALVPVAVSLGLGETLLGLLASILVMGLGTAAHLGPVPLIHPDPQDQLAFLRRFYLLSFAALLPVAASLERSRVLERTLARSTRFTDQILGNMREVVFRADTQGRWTYLNPAWEPISGASVTESLGQPMAHWLTAGDGGPLSAALTRLTRGEVDELELSHRLRRADDVLLETEITMRVLRDETGGVAGVGGILRDVTEQRASYRALETSERRFRALCDAAPVGILRGDLAGGITYVNWMFELVALAPRAQLVGQPLGAWLGEAESFTAEALAQHLNVPEARLEREVAIRDGAGQPRWLAVVLTSDFDSAGARLGYIAAVADITRRKHAEMALAEKSAELSILAENISDVVLRIGLDGIYRYATPSARELTGATSQELVGQRAMQRVIPEDQPVMKDAFERMARGEADFLSISFRSLTPGGDRLYGWREAHCRLLRDAAGRPQEIIASVRNIDEHKRLESALIEARQRAEAAAAAKSAFLANISHEIRTPMNGVIGLTDLLLERELDATSRHYLRLIADSGATMMQLLDGVLDLAKLESGRLVLSDEPVDLRELLSGSLALMTAPAVGKGLSVALDVADNVPSFIRGDRLRLRQVLVNLISNAVKFTQAGHVALSARAQGDTLVLTVADTGIGIAPEAQKAVFEEFVQASRTVNGDGASPGGTGLGLPIARRLVLAMGGTLELASTPGSGTRITLRLPGCLAPAPRPAEPASPPTPGPPGLPPAQGLPPARQDTPGHPLRVLVAEDNHTNQIIAAGMLERLGHSTSIAADGAQAVAMVKAAAGRDEPFDLVLMDMLMPGMDGLEATRALRGAGFDARALPIVALTANAFAEDMDKCLAAGMQHHLAKPLRLAELDHAIATLMNGQEAPETPAGSPN